MLYNFWRWCLLALIHFQNLSSLDTRSDALTENGSVNNMAIHRWTESKVATVETASLHLNFGHLAAKPSLVWLGVGLSLILFSKYLTLSNTAKHCWHVCWWGYHGINSVGTVQGRNTLRWAGQRRADTAWRLVITPGTGQVSLRQTRNLCRLL